MRRGREFFASAGTDGGRVYAARIIGPAKDPRENGLWFGQGATVWANGQSSPNTPNLDLADIRVSLKNLRGAISTAGGEPRFGKVEIIEFAMVPAATHTYKKKGK